MFREYLNNNYNKNTADRYYFAVDKLLKGIQFNNVNEINIKFVEENLSKIRTKSNFSAAKNGLKQFNIVFPELVLPNEEYFKNLSVKKKNRSIKPKNTLYLDEIRRKINSLKNNKYKYAFRLMLISGLRVNETAALTKSDIVISDNKITIMVRNGKGGSNGLVECLPDEYLIKKLNEYIHDKAEDEKLFYTTKTMQSKAQKIGIECHDLRRIAAITHRKMNVKEQGVYVANNGVKKLLRHKRFSTTKRYLFNKKLVFQTKKELEINQNKG